MPALGDDVVGVEGTEYGGGNGGGEFGDPPPNLGSWESGPSAIPMDSSLGIALQQTPPSSWSPTDLLPDTGEGWAGMGLGTLATIFGGPIGLGTLGSFIGGKIGRSRQEDLDRERAQEFVSGSRPTNLHAREFEGVMPPPPPPPGMGEGEVAIRRALPVDPVSELPVAAGPQLMAAPTPTVMGMPVGYDPTTAGRTYTDFTRTAQRGGLMDLQHQAHNVAAQGRGGDSMLVHMRPDEVAGLAALGGVTRNPQTGMPEHFLGSTLGSLAGLALAPFTGGMSSFLNPFVMQGLGAGLGQFAESKMRGEENALQKGLTSGLMAGIGSWGLGKLGSSATAAGTASTPIHGPSGKVIASTPKEAGWLAGAEKYFPETVTQGTKAFTGTGTLAQAEPWMGAAGMGLGSGAVTDMMMPYMPEVETGEFTSAAELTPRYKRTARDLSEEDLTRYGMGPEGRFFSTQRFQEGGLAEVGAMMEEAGPGGDVVAEEVTAQAVSAVRGDHPEPEKAITAYVEMFGEESFGRLREMVVQEMQVESAGGRQEIETEGMISGPGAGRDDLIRGSIEGEEELRVSDGEFIVPADVVSGIGDGSSDAGAKRLYAMMDRVRQTRTGTTRQPGRVNEQQMLPV